MRVVASLLLAAALALAAAPARAEELVVAKWQGGGAWFYRGDDQLGRWSGANDGRGGYEIQLRGKVVGFLRPDGDNWKVTDTKGKELAKAGERLSEAANVVARTIPQLEAAAFPKPSGAGGRYSVLKRGTERWWVVYEGQAAVARMSPDSDNVLTVYRQDTGDIVGRVKQEGSALLLKDVGGTTLEQLTAGTDAALAALFDRHLQTLIKAADQADLARRTARIARDQTTAQTLAPRVRRAYVARATSDGWNLLRDGVSVGSVRRGASEEAWTVYGADRQRLGTIKPTDGGWEVFDRGGTKLGKVTDAGRLRDVAGGTDRIDMQAEFYKVAAFFFFDRMAE